MLRRLLPTIAGLFLGFLILLWGLVSLERVFRRERDEARANVARAQDTLADYARRTLEQLLDRRLGLAEREIDEALADPLLDAGHLLLVERGRQLLPRTFVHLEGAATPAGDLYADLAAGGPPAASPEPDSPWAEQLALQQAVTGHLRRGDRRAIERSFRALLAHRSRYRIAPARDLPATLALLELFADDSRAEPHPDLLRALLLDGLADGRGGELRGLGRLLLEHRESFSRPDFELLCGRLAALAESSGVPHQALGERCAEASAAMVPLPSRLVEPILVDGGRWFARPDGGGPAARVVGTAADLSGLLDQVAGEMRHRGLLTPEEEIRGSSALDGALPVAELELAIDSGRWPRQLLAIDGRYRLKAGLVLLCGALAATMAALAVALQVRRHRTLELRSEFVATVSHELKTPLASVRLMAETVARRSGSLPGLKDYPARIVREIDGLHFLVENILSFNRLEGGRVRPHFSRLSVDELFDEVGSEIGSQLSPAADREVRFRSPPTGATVVADPELLKLLLMNLARNACLYNDRDPVEIELAWQARPAGGGEILVHDNGRGIPEAERRRIFDEFYRPRDSAQRPGSRDRGTGLGLAICRRIIELHRGRIEIADSGPEGTTFRISLPGGEEN